MEIFRDFIPIDMHCHGIGKFDFMEPSKVVLDRINDQLSIENIRSIITLYIPQSKIHELRDLVDEYQQGLEEGKYERIAGLALEGPLLASFGGTPEQGCWVPTKEEWFELAKMGQHGLKYIVLSPDADFGSARGSQYPDSFRWVVDTLYEYDVRPALGHFKKGTPEESASKVTEMVDYIAQRNYKPLFTDHLFNDMPLNFKHCWRSLEEKMSRVSDLANLEIEQWNLLNMREKLGPVPAAIIAGAIQGHVKICMNFDGEHVDLEVCRAAVKLIGSENLMLMTDRIQSKVLAGQKLHRKNNSTLLYQNKGIVAGGTLSVMRQLMKMISLGLDVKDILNIASVTGSRQLNITPFVNHSQLEKNDQVAKAVL